MDARVLGGQTTVEPPPRLADREPLLTIRESALLFAVGLPVVLVISVVAAMRVLAENGLGAAVPAALVMFIGGFLALYVPAQRKRIDPLTGRSRSKKPGAAPSSDPPPTVARSAEAKSAEAASADESTGEHAGAD